ncbi:MAG: TIGR02710 family CRISPR-associated CARF protein [Candidatus Geothermincolales bacterium]
MFHAATGLAYKVTLTLINVAASLYGFRKGCVASKINETVKRTTCRFIFARVLSTSGGGDGMSKYLVCTVGTGRGVEHGIAVSIKKSNPEKVVFIVSQESRSTIERIRALGEDVLANREVSELVLSDEEHVQDCALKAIDCLLELINEGAPREEITCDFTSGTKAMTAGLCVAAVTLGIPSLSYVVGERDKANGRVISGSEDVRTVSVGRLYVRETEQRLKELFNQRRFSAGLSVSDYVLERFFQEDIQNEFSNWRSLFEAFYRWDLFDHVGAYDVMMGIDKGFLAKLGLESLQPSKEFLGKITRRASTAENSQVADDDRLKGKALLLELLMADLLANSDRRAEEGRYDDAVARLYRACEMAAQKALLEKGHNPSDLDLDALPPMAREEICAPSPGESKSKVAMDETLRLLKALGDDRADLYLENKRLRDLLTARNNSILAHGIEPVGREKQEALREEVLSLCNSFSPNLEQNLRLAKFPIIDVEL